MLKNIYAASNGTSFLKSIKSIKRQLWIVRNRTSWLIWYEQNKEVTNRSKPIWWSISRRQSMNYCLSYTIPLVCWPQNSKRTISMWWLVLITLMFLSYSCFRTVFKHGRIASHSTKRSSWSKYKELKWLIVLVNWNELICMKWIVSRVVVWLWVFFCSISETLALNTWIQWRNAWMCYVYIIISWIMH